MAALLGRRALGTAEHALVSESELTRQGALKRWKWRRPEVPYWNGHIHAQRIALIIGNRK